MQAFRLHALRSPATWYVLAGAALIASSLWAPWWAASRTTRVEVRADRLAELLLVAAQDLPLPPAAADLEHLLARFWALADADGVFFTDVERVASPPDDTLLCLTNKHYAFHLAISPIPSDARPDRDTRPALEVLAWPNDSTGPGHSVYYHAEDAPRAYTRNLANGYFGFGRERPRPGAGQPRSDHAQASRRSYRSATDERWILY